MCQILKLSYYQNYYTNHNQIVHSDKDHQVSCVGGPNMPQTKSKIVNGHRLEKIKKSQYLCYGYTDFDEIWHGEAI